MSKRSRRKFTDEFKAEAVKLVTEEGYQIAEAARNFRRYHQSQRENAER